MPARKSSSGQKIKYPIGDGKRAVKAKPRRGSGRQPASAKGTKGPTNTAKRTTAYQNNKRRANVAATKSKRGTKANVSSRGRKVN